MKTVDAIKHFGSKQAVADVLGIRQPSVQNWGEYPPPEKQVELQGITHGVLKAEPEVAKHYKQLARYLR